MSRFPWSGVNTFSALGNRIYRFYWFFNLASSAAALMLNMARGWLVYDLTNSPFLLGVVVGAFSIPIIVLALPGGALTDRVSKRKLMMVSELVVAFLNLGLATLIAMKLIAVWHLVLASFISGIAFSFGQPAKQAIIHDIVERSALMNAIALSSTGFNVMRVLAPSIAGFLLAFLGMAPVYFIGTGLVLLSVIFLLFIPDTPGLREKSRSSFSGDIIQGIKYMYRDKTIFTVLVVTFIATLSALPFQFMLPIFAKDILKAGEVGLGWMMGAIGLGAIISTLAIASMGDYRHKSVLFLGFMVFLGVFLIFFSFSKVLVVSLFFLMISGMFGTGFNTMSNTMLQVYSSDDMRGRVMSIMTIAFGLAPLGTMPLGAIAEFTGAPFSLALGGGLAAFIALVVYIFNRQFRQL